jgi:glutamate carboxypeptidase
MNGTELSETVSSLEGRRDEMVEALDELVSAESPSDDPQAVGTCMEVLSELAGRLIEAAPETVDSGSHRHLVWRFGREPRVLLLGHLDTVWPRGTIQRWPFSVEDDRASGPGVFDMKAGLLQLFFALTYLGNLDGVEVIVTSDEEIGSPTSKELIETHARKTKAALVLEPSLGGALKTARKGISTYEIVAKGRAAHAGLDPESGANAALEIAYQLPQLADLARGATTVTPTLLRAGTTTNTVPALATCAVDVRAATIGEQDRVDAEIRDLTPHVAGCSIEVLGGPNRPPLPRSASAVLFEAAQGIAAALGIADLEGVEAGGGSDGNLTAGVGTPTLDGLGAVGAGAHAEGEHVLLSHFAVRTALVTGLVDRLLHE